MMEYRGYLGRVEYDDDAGLFHGEVVNLRDVITFQGTCVEELRQAFFDSIEEMHAVYDHYKGYNNLVVTPQAWELVK